MKYAAELGSGVMIYVPSFINLVRAFKVNGRRGSQTQTHRHIDSIEIV
jgi:hypothetical protein